MEEGPGSNAPPSAATRNDDASAASHDAAYVP
eukprot:CAMPEP_0180191404 /NCGR_PEP_ID=MMETSP0987-20121128/1409_1 /TAXON_ID=697907 /ORGANISM="non described non described, Strain CCMP2293" /LENGTH=31 /DNA_ID= /DNA_START= /DNA_END= /DNA_ORIENTATION=